ncbi:hypothetical protein [Actinoplanes sp. NPDC089786]|uniref:hypothetical protein n=1 Tax=Actinoplanes sp. NPDC089786 TaxID=3155185 RepID=UPI0034146CB7
MLAEYAILQGRSRHRRSQSLTEAATLPCAGLTTWTALSEPALQRSTAQADDTVLVLGTGGVSLYAAQLAHAVSAQVWATTSDRSKHNRLAALEIAGVVDYTEVESWGCLSPRFSAPFQRHFPHRMIVRGFRVHDSRHHRTTNPAGSPRSSTGSCSGFPARAERGQPGTPAPRSKVKQTAWTFRTA